jgi:predicted metal-binding membrane protein
MITVTPLLGGILLVFAGVYQFTPLKTACLSQCRTPLGFLLTEWREGTRGALIMGARHGIYCVGCCWLLMALLFVAGVMNLLWVALIAVCILVEKVVPEGQWVSQAIGALTIGWGIWLLVQVWRM